MYNRVPLVADSVGQDSWEQPFKFILFLGDLSFLILDLLIPIIWKQFLFYIRGIQVLQYF